MEATVFREDEVVAVVPPGHALLVQAKPVPAAQLCAEPFLLREPGSGTREVVEQALLRRGLWIENPVMSLGSTEAIKRAVAAGIGVSIVSRLTIGLELAAGTLTVLPLADLVIRRPLYCLRLHGMSTSQAARAFLQMLVPG